MKQFIKLTLFQIKDKLDFSWIKSQKRLIQTIVFSILKFIAVTVVAFGLLFLLSFIGFINKYDGFMPMITTFLTIVLFLNLCSSTYGLMKSLYFADDNKVLITLPVKANTLFFSKLSVYFAYEIKKAFSLLIPSILGFLIFGALPYKGVEVSGITTIWMIIPIILIIVIQLLLSAILSIPFLFVYRLFKRNQILDLIVVVLAVTILVVGVIHLIGKIPDDIVLQKDWPSIQKNITGFLITFNRHSYPINYCTNLILGETTGGKIHYALSIHTLFKFLIALGTIGVLGVVVFFLIRPFYFRMIYKTFEYDKNPQLAQKKNVKHRKYFTFANKEFKLSFRDFDISGSYIAIYIIVPILLLLMDRVYASISKSNLGDGISIAANLLLTILPLLASNSTIATLYSKEGRTAYLTKSNPVNPFIPLTSKLLFNLVFSIPSIIACSIIFANFSSLGVLIAALFSVSVLLIQYAHIFYSAAQDIMNPQNEVYATSGSDFNNPNESRATIVAFVASFVITLIFYFMLDESMRLTDGYLSAFIRLFIVAAFLFAGFLYLFIQKIKAFYYEK